ELFVKLFDTQDQTEGVNAFLEKRKAKWVNG
ncbi:enoyl-CoA hydratase, partial [Pseudoalteromonas rubra]